MSAFGHHSAQDGSWPGLRTSAPQAGQARAGSSFQISTSRRHPGHRTYRMSSGFQYRWSCPGQRSDGMRVLLRSYFPAASHIPPIRVFAASPDPA